MFNLSVSNLKIGINGKNGGLYDQRYERSALIILILLRVSRFISYSIFGVATGSNKINLSTLGCI